MGEALWRMVCLKDKVLSKKKVLVIQLMAEALLIVLRWVGQVDFIYRREENVGRSGPNEGAAVFASRALPLRHTCCAVSREKKQTVRIYTPRTG